MKACEKPEIPGPKIAKPGSILAAFMELRGRKVVEGCGALWHSVEGGFFMSLPYQSRLDPEPGEIQELVRSLPAVGARFPSRSWPGLPSGVYIRRGKTYDLKDVHHKQRSRVSRGMERFEIRTVEPAELLAQGPDLNRDTMMRQGRFDPEFGEPSRWNRLMDAVRRSPSVEAIGAFSNSRLAAYLITCREDGTLHILHQMSRREDLKDFPNHALTYYVTKRAAGDPTLECVCYGSLSLVRTEGLHEYKVRFGYEVAPHSMAIQLHPLLGPVLGSSAARGLTRAVRAIWPNNQRMERIEVVLQAAHLSANATRCQASSTEARRIR